MHRRLALNVKGLKADNRFVKIQLDLNNHVFQKLNQQFISPFKNRAEIDWQSGSFTSGDFKEVPATMSGIYVIFTKSRKVLYVGKGKPILARLKLHHGEMQETHNNCPAFWKVFFSYFKNHNIELFYGIIEVADEPERVVIEKCLEQQLDPLFTNLKSQFPKANPRLKTDSKAYKQFKANFQIHPAVKAIGKIQF